jgi:hypothetical protein
MLAHDVGVKLSAYLDAVSKLLAACRSLSQRVSYVLVCFLTADITLFVCFSMADIILLLVAIPQRVAAVLPRLKLTGLRWLLTRGYRRKQHAS